MMKMAPGDPAEILKAQAAGGSIQSQQASIAAIEEWKKERHLDKPWYQQYYYWVRDLCKFDLGRAFTPPRQRVSALILERLGITIGLNLVAFFLIYLIAIPVGVICAAKQFT